MDSETGRELLSDRLKEWLDGDGDKSLGDLVATFGPQSFAILFVVLMAFPALPLPTGGVSHVLEIVTMLLALELVIGRTEVWLPRRLQRRRLALSGGKFSRALVKRIRWFERFSRPRLAALLGWRPTGVLFGAVVLGLALAAFLAPPFSGLDTLPALGVVVLSLGMLLGDVLIAGAGVVIGLVGVGLVVFLGRAALSLL